MKAYNQILKSAAILGSARAMTMIIGLGRVKLIAIFLGPAGLGLIATFETIIETTIHLTGLGTSRSGIRQIARARNSEDPTAPSKAAITMRRLAFVLGSFGTIVVAALAQPISVLTFDTDQYANYIAIFSPSILLTSLYACSRSTLQGMQRIAILAKYTIIAAVISGSVIPLFIWTIGEQGIPYALVTTASLTVIAVRFFERSIQLPKVKMSWSETLRNSPEFIKLGIGLSNAILLSSLVTYATRSYLNRDLGLEAVGIYLCAFYLSGKFIGFLLDALQNDFYPRLSAVADDHKELNTLINQQIEIILLLALPGLLITLSLAPWLVLSIYSSEFYDATDLIRIYMLGCLFRVIWAPMGFVRLAKGKSLIYFLSEACLNITHFGLIILFIKTIGLHGIAFSYVMHNLIQLVALFIISNRLTGFRFTPIVAKLLISSAFITIVSAITTLYTNDFTGSGIGLIAVLIVSFFCLRQLTTQLGPEHKISRLVAKIPIVNRHLT